MLKKIITLKDEFKRDLGWFSKFLSRHSITADRGTGCWFDWHGMGGVQKFCVSSQLSQGLQ